MSKKWLISKKNSLQGTLLKQKSQVLGAVQFNSHQHEEMFFHQLQREMRQGHKSDEDAPC